MSSTLGKRGQCRISPVLRHLSIGRRRRILEILRRRERAVDEAEIARRLVAAEEEGPAPSEDAVRSARIDLAHVHLPALEEADLVAWNESAGTARAEDHPFLRDPAFERVLDTDDETLDCLADERRRIVVSALRDHGGSMPRRALAHEVVARDGDADSTSDAVEATLRALHHVHIPKLRAADLVTYDADTGRVEAEETAERVAAWIGDISSESSKDGACWLASSLG